MRTAPTRRRFQIPYPAPTASSMRQYSNFSRPFLSIHYAQSRGVTPQTIFIEYLSQGRCIEKGKGRCERRERKCLMPVFFSSQMPSECPPVHFQYRNLTLPLAFISDALLLKLGKYEKQIMQFRLWVFFFFVLHALSPPWEKSRPYSEEAERINL